MAAIIDVSALPTSGTAYRFEGGGYGGSLSFFLVETPPGRGPGLDTHHRWQGSVSERRSGVGGGS